MLYYQGNHNIVNLNHSLYQMETKIFDIEDYFSYNISNSIGKISDHYNY